MNESICDDYVVGENDRKKYILVSGFGWSGSGAVIDYLKDYNKIKTFSKEFRLFKDFDGLFNLRTQFFENSYFFNTIIAIEKFMRFANVLYRENSLPLGLSYKDEFGENFIKSINTFKSRILEEKFLSDAFVFYYQNNDFSQIVWKIKRRFGLSVSGKKYALPVGLEEFDCAAKKLIEEIFSNTIIRDEFILLDQAVNPWDIESINTFIDNYRCIIVGRDPRDVYVDYFKSKDIYWSVESFIHNYRSLYSKTEKKLVNANVLYIQFEDFVLNFEKLSLDIEKFLNLEKIQKSEMLFNSEKSRKNIGLYKKFEFYKDIKKIESELYEYCYN